jgi:hypothetical protein
MKKTNLKCHKRAGAKLFSSLKLFIEIFYEVLSEMSDPVPDSEPTGFDMKFQIRPDPDPNPPLTGTGSLTLEATKNSDKVGPVHCDLSQSTSVRIMSYIAKVSEVT